MSNESFQDALSSKFWLRFKDSKLEEKYHKVKEIAELQTGRKLFISLIIGLVAMLVSIIITEDYKDKHIITEDEREQEFGGRMWALYVAPALLVGAIIELLMTKGSPWMKKCRGMLVNLIYYTLIGEPHIYMFSDILPVAFFDRGALTVVALISIQGNYYSYSWVWATLINYLGILYVIIRFIVSSNVSFVEYMPLLLLGAVFTIAFYSRESSDRKRFHITVQYKKQEKQWRELLEKLPTGVLISKKQENKLVFCNHSTTQIFQPPSPPQLTSLVDQSPLTDRSGIFSMDNPPILSDSPRVDFSNSPHIPPHNLPPPHQEHNIQNPSQHLLQGDIEQFVLQMETKFLDHGFNTLLDQELNWGQTCNTLYTKYLQVQRMEIDMDREGSCVGLILRDNTNQRLIDLETTKLAQHKEIFFASMSHELRNPLNALLGCLEMMNGSILESNRELYEIARICGDTLYNLIGNILDISKIENNKLELQAKKHNFKDTIDRVVTMCRTIGRQKGIYLQVEWGVNMPTYFRYDHPRLMQVVMNIISNSIKFTDRGGVILKVDWIPTHNEDPMGETDPLFKALIESSEMHQYIETVNECSPSKKNKQEKLHHGPKVFNTMQSIFCEARERISPMFSPLPEFDSRGCKSLEFEIEVMAEEDEEVKPETVEMADVSGIRHTHNNSEIDNLNSTATQGYIKIQIIDTGCGIAKNEIDKLFQPFGQASHSNQYGGSGLGLWISKKILNLMNGDVKIYSSIGNGSNFVCVFPLEIGENIEEEETVASLKGAPNFKSIYQYPILYLDLRCLYVEDEDYNRKIVKEMMERSEMTVFTARNGLDGFNIFQDNIPNYFNMIFTDLRMPIMSGQEMIKKIREYEISKNLSSTPIIIISGEPSEIEIDRCINQLKANAFLNKPLNLAKLQTTLLKILKYNEVDTLSPILDNRKKVLIVDDDVFSSKMTFKMLINNDIETLQAFTLKDGFGIFQDHYTEIKIIILDSQLPDGRGTDLAKSIRQFESEHSLSEITVLFSISGNSKEMQMEDYAGIPINEFLEKPIMMSQFIALVQNYIIQNIRSQTFEFAGTLYI